MRDTELWVVARNRLEPTRPQPLGRKKGSDGAEGQRDSGGAHRERGDRARRSAGAEEEARRSRGEDEREKKKD